MKAINQYIRTNFLEDKSVKSLWKVLNGARTQQTYFDAVMQDLLPVYELYPNVSLDDIEKQILRLDSGNNIKLYPYFHYATDISFTGLLLLLQSVSENLYHSTDYIPMTNRLFIQQHVKMIFAHIKNENLFMELAKEVEQLVQYVEKETGTCYFIHLLSGHDITPASYELLAIQYNKAIDDIATQIFIEKNIILHWIKYQSPDILKQLYARTPLHLNTNDTYKRLLSGASIETIQHEKGVRIHTIQDHIIEILIKDYPLDISLFLSHKEYQLISKILEEHQFGRLKSYFELSPVKDYFKLKLAIVKYKMERLI